MFVHVLIAFPGNQSLQAFFFNFANLEQTCSSNFSRGIHSEGVFTIFLFSSSQNSIWEPNKGRPTWFLPTTKPVQRERLNSSSPASQHLTKDIFDVIQNNVYLPSVCHSFVYELSLYAALIGVCVLFLCVCHRGGRRWQLTANNTALIRVVVFFSYLERCLAKCGNDVI